MVDGTTGRDQAPVSRIGFAYPPPSTAGTGYDLIADKYDEFYEDRLGRAENAVVRRSLLRGPSSAVLDLGCGNGAAARLLAAGGRIPIRYVGTDLSLNMLRRWHSTWAGGEELRCGTDVIWDHSNGLRLKSHGHTLDLIHQSMVDPLPPIVYREFDLVTALWSLGYLEQESLYQTLRQAAEYSIGRGARLVATLCTRSFCRTKYEVQRRDSLKTFAGDKIADLISYNTQWKVTNVVGLTGPLCRALGGRAYTAASAVDRVIAKPHKHTYILIEATIQ